MIMWIIGAVILIGLVGWAVVRIINTPPPVGTDSVAMPRDKEISLFNGPTETYTDPVYGFSISYPSDLHTTRFAAFHALGNKWRVNAPSESRGTSVVAIPIIRIDSGTSSQKTYPLFFDAEVRIGISDDTANCYASDEGYTLQTVADVDIGGVTWKKFIFGDAATMQYLSGASYRVVRNNRCYVVEQIRTGSAYRDDSMAVTYTEQDLDAFFARTTPIVMSFRFTD